MTLLDLVDAGDLDGVLRELRASTLEERACYAAELTERREALGARWTPDVSEEVKVAHCAAEWAGQVTPEAAAAWLVKPKPTTSAYVWKVNVAELYPAEWRVELVRVLDEQAGSRWPGGSFAMAEHIVRDTGCPIPTSDAFINAWRLNRQARHVPRPAHLLGGAPGATMAERLRNDDFTPVLLPLAMARPTIDIWQFPDTLIELAADGIVDRDALVRRMFAEFRATRPHMFRVLQRLALTPDEHVRTAPERVAFVESLLARLHRDGTRMQTAEPLAALRLLAPTREENASFLRDYLAMLDLSLPLATYGQEVLIDLDEAGLLEADVPGEASERVLLRPEKKLVRAQLSWLDRVARRDRRRAGGVVAAAALAFQHTDLAVQERALKLVARHRSAAGEAALPELRAAAASLSPALAPRAAELLGAPREPAEPYAEVLPAAPEPRAVPGPAATPVEAAQEVAAVFADPRDVVAFERALDGLVRHARLDRGALCEALAPVMRGKGGDFTVVCTQADLYDVAAAVRGEPREWPESLLPGHPMFHFVGGTSAVAPAADMLRARLNEAIAVIESGVQPFLLAVPTHATGALDAAVLVRRIAEFEELGVAPAPVDLAQALLRVDPAPAESVAVAAEKLESDAGRRLARWLRDGGLEHQDSTPAGWPTGAPPFEGWEPAVPGPAAEPALPPVAAALVGPRRAAGVGPSYSGPPWAAQLPHHGDEVVARAACDEPSRVLASVAESCNPAGFAVHWELAKAVNADVLLVLAARGRLDSGLLGEQLQVLGRTRPAEGRMSSVTAALRAAAETGAYATVWSVLESALPGLLRGTPLRGAGALLALAVECATRCGAKGHIPEVDTLADRKGSTQTVKNARLLRDTLRG